MANASIASSSTEVAGHSTRSTPTGLDPSHPMIRSLYYRAMDATETESIFRDQTALDIVEKFHDELAILECVPAGMRYLLTTRCMLIDLYCSKFMEHYANQGKECTILNLSGGLDTRVYRLRPKSHVQWLEVDKPGWVELRAQHVKMQSTDNVHWIPVDISDPAWLEDGKSWLDDIPKNNPTLVIIEGVAVTFRRSFFDKIIRKLLDHLETGEIVLDVNGRAAQIMVATRWLSWSRKVRATMEWSCEHPTTLESIHPKLKFVEQKSCVTLAEEDFDDWGSVVGKVKLSIVKGGIFGSTVRNQSRVLRFTF